MNKKWRIEFLERLKRINGQIIGLSAKINRGADIKEILTLAKSIKNSYHGFYHLLLIHCLITFLSDVRKEEEISSALVQFYKLLKRFG